MYLEDLIPTPNSKQIAAVSHKVFGRSINMESLTKEKALSLRETFAERLGSLETKLGANVANNPMYLENKLFLETIDTYLGEETETDYNSMSMTQLRRAYASLEDENDHSEAALLLATVYGTDAQKEEVEAIKARHRQNGSIEREDQKARDAISSELYPELKQGVTESVIVEGEIEAAEQVMASKNIVDKIQKMLEDIGGMLNEDLPPLTDSIRDNMDSSVAEQFNAAMSQTLGAALEGMRQTREQADQAARILTGDAAPAMMGDEAMTDPDAELAMEPTTDMEMDVEAPAEEDFAASDAAQDGEEELGRARRA